MTQDEYDHLEFETSSTIDANDPMWIDLIGMWDECLTLMAGVR